MAQNSWCRVCLAVDVRMHWIKNTRLLEIFKKLSSTKLNVEDGRPHTLCYICYSQLQRCCRFSDMCHKSEQYQIEHLRRDSEVEGEVPQSGITHNLTVSALPFMSIIDSSNQGNTVVKVKHELLNKEKEIEVKEETIDIEESTLVEDNSMEIKQLPIKVNTEINNVSALQYCCDVCSKTFLLKRSLSQHMRVHISKKQYACTRCKKIYNKIKHLQIHMRSHTGVKPYTCNMCNKSFTIRSNLQRHMKIHTGEKPFACNICNKSFTIRSNLQRHMKIHTGEKPYACNMCNKSFTDRSNLLKHMRIHTGEKPHACNICNKAFTVRGDLQRHDRIHTGEKLISLCYDKLELVYN